MTGEAAAGAERGRLRCVQSIWACACACAIFGAGRGAGARAVARREVCAAEPVRGWDEWVEFRISFCARVGSGAPRACFIFVRARREVNI